MEYAAESPAKSFGKSFPFFSKFFPKWTLSWRSYCERGQWCSVYKLLEKIWKNVFYERRSYGGSVGNSCLLHMFEKTLRHRIVPLEPDERRDASTESSAGDVQCTRTKSLWPLGPSPSQRVHYAAPVVRLVLRSCERYLTPVYSQRTHTTPEKTEKIDVQSSYTLDASRVWW